MDDVSQWLEKRLSEERNDILHLLDAKHKALLGAFKARLTHEDGEQSPVSSQTTEREGQRPRVSPRRLAKPLSTMSRVKTDVTTMSDKRQLLTSFFELIDSDGNGQISLDEVRAALQTVGKSPAQARRVIADMVAMCKDTIGFVNGEIRKKDWVRVVESQSHVNVEMCEFARKLQRRAFDASVRKKEVPDCCILRVDSHYRLLWNFLCFFCCLYIVVFVPYWFAFDPDDATMVVPAEKRGVIAKIIDVIFLIDILINFRTSYYANGKEVRRWQKITQHYLSSWFVMDALSSIPFSFLETTTSETMKLVKFVRLFSIIKVMRSAKAFNLLSQSAFGEGLEEFIIEHRLQGKVKLLYITLALLFCSHWLACAMAACGMQFLELLSDGFLEPGSLYIPSFYWAMTTVCTVGYGDIIPRTDVERIVAVVAMCVGGTFYALNIGLLTSIVLAHDRAEAERASRMEVVNNWLRRHAFPSDLKRRVRRYFKGYLSHAENSTREELDLFEDLTSDLRLDVARVLVPEEVRVVPIFACVPDFVTGFLVSILQMVSFQANEVVVKAGECGVAMFVIVGGKCVKTTPANADDANSIDMIVASLFVGESFGEEIILGLAEEYSYNVKAQESSDLYSIAEHLFSRSMARFPQHLESMRECFRQSTGLEASVDHVEPDVFDL